MDSAKLKDANPSPVAKQRRQEAKFFQNFDFIVENDLLGKFASMKALLSEVAKLQKPKAENTEGEAKSDSGPSTEGETQSETVTANKLAPMSASDIAFEAMLRCDANGISFKDLLLALQEQQSFSTARQPNGCLTFHGGNYGKTWSNRRFGKAQALGHRGAVLPLATAPL